MLFNRCFRKAKKCIVVIVWALIVATVTTTVLMNGRLRAAKRSSSSSSSPSSSASLLLDHLIPVATTTEEEAVKRNGEWIEELGTTDEDDGFDVRESVQRLMEADVSLTDESREERMHQQMEDEILTGEDGKENIAMGVNALRQRRAERKSSDELMADHAKRTNRKCDLYSPHLKGMLEVDSKRKIELREAVRGAGVNLINGCWIPPSCEAVQKIAVVIPYKNRYEHLLMLTKHLHPILQRQGVSYCVFVAEQYDNGSFNKAQIMNAAFREITDNYMTYGHPSDVDAGAGRRRPFDCFVFHDVDMLMENDRNLYVCEDDPKHLSPAIDKFNYTTHYGTIYGGVTAMKAETYKLVNGHSNRFWGWGGEDNDMEKRIQVSGKKILQVNATVGRYKMIVHEHPWWFSPETGAGSWKRKQGPKAPSINSHVPKKKSTLEKQSESAASKESEEEAYRDRSGLSDIKYQLVYASQHLLWTKLMIDIRFHVFERSSSHFINYVTDDVGVASPQSVASDQPDDEDNADERNDELDACSPVYHKFDHMTVNRTQPDEDKRYSTVYFSLEEAEKICNELRTSCMSIVEQKKGTFTLRSTAFVQENKLTYKLGIIDQYDVYENHHTTAVYVKVCPGDMRYLQFAFKPIILASTAKRASSPRFVTNFNIRVLQRSNISYTYRTRIMTSHRAVMEAKINSKLAPKIWWDSLGKLQFGRFSLLNFSDQASLRAHRVVVSDEQRPHAAVAGGRQGNMNAVYAYASSPASLEPFPGCYVIKHSIINDVSDEPVYEWSTWVQVRGETLEYEEELLAEQLRNSIHMGEEFRRIQERNKAMANQWIHERKRYRPPTLRGDAPAPAPVHRPLVNRGTLRRPEVPAKSP